MYEKRPYWLKKKATDQSQFFEMANLLKELSLNTVCGEAECPNIGECFEKKTATFMILGRICTRNCSFCAVEKGVPQNINKLEPVNVAQTVIQLGLKHAVITSVTRDDLEDGGARHFVDTIQEIRKRKKEVTVEVLIPDFNGNKNAVQTVIDAEPQIINHNLETVPSLYRKVRPGANYMRSLNLLKQVKEINKRIITKTGLMLGLGEKEEEVYHVMNDLRKINCDILTLGQYLKSAKSHINITEYIRPETFYKYKEEALKKGFKYVESGPFVRSSYGAVNTLQFII